MEDLQNRSSAREKDVVVAGPEQVRQHPQRPQAARADGGEGRGGGHHHQVPPLHPNKCPEFTLRRFLAKDGWFTTTLLPEGYWLKQKRSERSFLSLTPNFVQLKTMKELFDHLRQDGHSEESVAIIQNNYRLLFSKNRFTIEYFTRPLKIIPL